MGKSGRKRRQRGRAVATSSEVQNSSSVVYAVYCHDGDQPIVGGAYSDLHNEYIHDARNVDAHYYAIYALPLPEPVPVPAYLDPPEKKQLKLKPLATLSLSKFPTSMGFAAIGSCIYMIGGRWKSDPSLEVFTIDTSRLPSRNTPLELEPVNVPRGPRLSTRKICPIVVTLFGKIFAIPTYFDAESDRECAEFLDLGSGSKKWKLIPGPKLVINRRLKEDYERLSASVGSCNVLGSFIVVTVVWGAVYELDAANPLEGWKLATRFTPMNMAGFSGTSEIIDGLLCFHEHVRYEAGFCFMACHLLDDLEHTAAQFPEYIGVAHTGGWKAGGDIRPKGRRSLNMGDGQAAVLTHGFTGDQSQSPELHLVLDIVSLDKVQMDKDKCPEGVPDFVVYLNRLKTVDYETGKVNTEYGCLCCCFRMLGSSNAFATTPSVVRYLDTVASSRLKKSIKIVH